MNLFLLLPTLLMVHNVVDFSQLGAPPSYANILNCAITDFVELLEAHNDLKLVNKTAVLDSKIRKIGLQFEAEHYYTLEHARTMMVGLVDSLLDALNRTPRLIPFRPSHCQTPFTADNVEIQVTFVDDCKFSYWGFEQIKFMTFRNGIISYYVAIPPRMAPCGGPLARLRDEPLDFARKVSPPPMQFVPPKCRPF